MHKDVFTEKFKNKKPIEKYFENCLDFLISSIDNGGRRSWVERRHGSRLTLLSDNGSVNDRRKIIDRRKQQNQKRLNGLERRAIFKNDG